MRPPKAGGLGEETGCVCQGLGASSAARLTLGREQRGLRQEQRRNVNGAIGNIVEYSNEVGTVPGSELQKGKGR